MDLQIKDHRKRKLWLIDVKCCYESKDSFKDCHERNIQKYKDYRSQVASKLKGWFVTLDTFIVGNLGSWNVGNNRILRNLGFKNKQTEEIAIQTIKRAIQWSNQIWKEHQIPRNLLQSENQQPDTNVSTPSVWYMV